MQTQHPKNDAVSTWDASILVCWSVQDIRRIAVRLAQRRFRLASIIAWSQCYVPTKPSCSAST